MSKKLYHKGTASKIVKVEDILAGHNTGPGDAITGYIHPGNTVEVSDECGEMLLRNYPREFLDLSKPIPEHNVPKKQVKVEDKKASGFEAADKK